ncbi:MAG TPA: dihydrofolate reductase [Candidatus Paceibacterota bacterium]|nr:dihydrofolate reductase [Candidatus Paceibacterota bacterium]
MRLGLIYARSRNGVIGQGGKLPWHLPEDLAHFKRKTAGCPVIMGRKTWDSVPPKFRPLPGRTNIVITRDAQWQAEGALRAASLSEAIGLCGDAPLAWITGGTEIFNQSLDIAHVAEVTEIDADFEGDTFAPTLSAHWHEVARERHTAANGLGYSFVTYERRS